MEQLNLFEKEKEEMKTGFEAYSEIFGNSLFALLKNTEGVVVHYQGKGYAVAKVLDELTGTYKVKIFENTDYLDFPHLQLLWISEEPEE